MILVGRPTKYAGAQANVLIDNFVLPELNSGQSLLEIAHNGDRYAVIVTGRDIDGPKIASNYLANWENYPDLLIGTEVLLTK